MKSAAFILGVLIVAWLAWAGSAPRDRPSQFEPLTEMRPRAPGSPTRDPFPATLPAPFPMPTPSAAGSAASTVPSTEFSRSLLIPVSGVQSSQLRPGFDENRGTNRRHEAIDIAAPHGTPVLAVDDGVIRKLFDSRAGGLTVYQYDPSGTHCYYYAHLQGYAPGIREGQTVRRGELIGYVGTTGNSAKDAPHLHFAVIRLDADRKWWGGTPIDPYPLLTRAAR